jgi:hypothetical protein
MERKYLPYYVHDVLWNREIQLIQAASEQEQESKQVDKSKAAPPPTAETVHRKTKVAEKGEKSRRI